MVLDTSPFSIPWRGQRHLWLKLTQSSVSLQCVLSVSLGTQFSRESALANPSEFFCYFSTETFLLKYVFTIAEKHVFHTFYISGKCLKKKAMV
jgi:hypothetical protein